MLGLSAAVVAYGLAMAYLESAVVVYLRDALAIEPDAIFPLRDPAAVGSLAAIEVGREAATVVMLAAVGWLAGRTWLERLAWVAVAFGVWDIGYYAWLWVFSGWPPSLDTWDLLFLIPVPWVGPVWAPVTVSLGLAGFGLAGAARLRAGERLRLGPAAALAGLAGGLLVVLSFTLDAGRIMDGGLPSNFPWYLFATGMLLGAWGAVRVLGAARPTP